MAKAMDSDYAGPTKKNVRCPECRTAVLCTPTILVRLDKRKKITIPFKICHRCKVIITSRAPNAGWKLWGGTDYLDSKN